MQKKLAALKKIALSLRLSIKKIVPSLNLFMSRTTTTVRTSCIMLLQEKNLIPFHAPLVIYQLAYIHMEAMEPYHLPSRKS